MKLKKLGISDGGDQPRFGLEIAEMKDFADY